MIKHILEIAGHSILLTILIITCIVLKPDNTNYILNEKDNIIIDLLRSTPQDVSSTTFYDAIKYDVSSKVMNEILTVNPTIVNYIDKLENTSLHNAIPESNTNILLVLMHKYPEAVKVKNSFGEYPIHLAIKYQKDIVVIKELLRIGRLPNLSYPVKQFMTETLEVDPLDYTIERTKVNNKTVSELLIENYRFY